MCRWMGRGFGVQGTFWNHCQGSASFIAMTVDDQVLTEHRITFERSQTSFPSFPIQEAVRHHLLIYTRRVRHTPSSFCLVISHKRIKGRKECAKWGDNCSRFKFYQEVLVSYLLLIRPSNPRNSRDFAPPRVRTRDECRPSEFAERKWEEAPLFLVWSLISRVQTCINYMKYWE